MIRCYYRDLMECGGLKASLIRLGALLLLYLDNRFLHNLASSLSLNFTSKLKIQWISTLQ